jgi:selenocysteine-specific elongation factor
VHVSADVGPLTVGTGGHIDHGKTALVRALTGVDTDRLPEEHARGISIDLGYAPLDLPSGRRLSVVDVPGHERFVQTMVAGATGVDLFLLVVAADDGVMPQTLEHWDVLQALGVGRGVIAITKSDLADPATAAAEAEDLGGSGVPIVACSSVTGGGLDALRVALDDVAATVQRRAAADDPAVLHVDRGFTIHGAGTVLTGTLWSGTLVVGDTVRLLPDGRRSRIRSLQVHGREVERAEAGQRVAVNVPAIARAAVRRGQVVVGREADVQPAWILDAALVLREVPAGGRVHVHHGTTASAARLVALGEDLWQIRARSPLMARAGDRIVVRGGSPIETLGGGTVVDPRAPRHSAHPDVVTRLRRLLRGEPVVEDAPAQQIQAVAVPERPTELSERALTLEQRLQAAGAEPLSREELADHVEELEALRAVGRAVRVGRSMFAHPAALDEVRQRVESILDREGEITLARLRDELGTSRKYAQPLLEYLDAARVTLRLPDDRRVRRGGARSSRPGRTS